jgi:hypothetical protein
VRRRLGHAFCEFGGLVQAIELAAASAKGFLLFCFVFCIVVAAFPAWRGLGANLSLY